MLDVVNLKARTEEIIKHLREKSKKTRPLEKPRGNIPGNRARSVGGGSSSQEDVVCEPADVFLTSQAEVDAFGEQACNVIEGDLDISGEDIRTLAPLKNIKKVTGELMVHDNPLLKSLHGLEALKESGPVTIIFNYILTSVSELKCLKIVDGVLAIAANVSLTKIDGINKLKSGALMIYVNNSLKTISGFCALEHAPFGLGFSIYVVANEHLTSIDAFNCLKSADGLVQIGGNPALLSIKAFEKLQTAGAFGVEGNGSLVCLPDLPSLSSVEFDSNPTDVTIGANDALKEICGFNALTSVQALIIDTNSSLKTLCGFNKLETADGIGIVGNELLETISGFRKLKTITGSLGLMHNEKLVSLDGLACVESVGDGEDDESVLIRANTSLRNLDGLIGLKYASSVIISPANSDLTSIRNLSLLQIDGLSSLVEVEDSVTVTYNPNLGAFAGLQPLSLVTPLPSYTINNNFLNPTKTEIQELTPSIRRFFENALNRYVEEGASPSAVKTVALNASCPLTIKAAVSCGGLTKAQAKVLLQALRVEAFQDQICSLPPKGPPLALAEPAKSAKVNGAIQFQGLCR